MQMLIDLASSTKSFMPGLHGPPDPAPQHDYCCGKSGLLTHRIGSTSNLLNLCALTMSRSCALASLDPGLISDGFRVCAELPYGAGALLWTR